MIPNGVNRCPAPAFFIGYDFSGTLRFFGADLSSTRYDTEPSCFTRMPTSLLPSVTMGREKRTTHEVLPPMSASDSSTDGNKEVGMRVKHDGSVSYLVEDKSAPKKRNVPLKS